MTDSPTPAGTIQEELTLPRIVWRVERCFTGPKDKDFFTYERILWARFDNWCLISSVGASKTEVVSANVIYYEKP